MSEPTRCPYCGSIENNGTVCDWCHSKINDMDEAPYDNQEDEEQ